MPSILEIIGPSMIGPSSSHTLGAMRISKFVYNLVGATPEKATFYLHGSFQDTYIGHGTWLALIAGLCGIATDDPEVARANEVAKKIGLEYEFEPVDLGNVHPNTVKIVTVKNGISHDVIGSSIGAGRITINSIDSVRCELDGEYPTLLIENEDIPGALELIIRIVAMNGVNIARINLKRESRHFKRANTVLELDNEINEDVMESLKMLNVVKSILYVKPL